MNHPVGHLIWLVYYYGCVNQWCLWLYFINRLAVIVQLKVDLMVLALGLIRGNSFTTAITEPKCVLNKYFKDISMLFACQQVHMKLNMKYVCVFIFQLVRYEKITGASLGFCIHGCQTPNLRLKVDHKPLFWGNFRPLFLNQRVPWHP